MKGVGRGIYGELLEFRNKVMWGCGDNGQTMAVLGVSVSSQDMPEGNPIGITPPCCRLKGHHGPSLSLSLSASTKVILPYAVYFIN